MACQAVLYDHQHLTTTTQLDIVVRTPSASKGTDLADGSSNTVELPTDGCRAALRREHAQAVARAKLTEAQENTVDDLYSISFVLNRRTARTYGERSDVVGQLRVKTAHDETDDSLAKQTEDLIAGC